MVKVLHKTLDILEFLGAAPGEQRSLEEIALATGVNRATCARIVRDLEARGYLERRGRRKGFYLGPMAFLLPYRDIYRPDLTDIARPILEALSEKLHTNIVLSMFHGMNRFILMQTACYLDLEFVRNYRLDTVLYDTMSGRLMLAAIDSGQREAYIRKHGMPGTSWPEIENEAHLRRALDAIGKQGYCIEQWRPESARYAFPVLENGKLVAVLGGVILCQAFTPDAPEFQTLRQAARDIGRPVGERQRKNIPC